MERSILIFLLLVIYCCQPLLAEYQSTEDDSQDVYDDEMAVRWDFFFTESAYNATIEENAVSRTYIVPLEKMGIYLKDPTIIVKYRVKSAESRLFKAEERILGNFCFLRIRLRTGSYETINRERISSYDLTVRATGRHANGPKFSTSTNIKVKVLDANDLYPLFFPEEYVVEVAEDTPVHSSVIQVSATDADAGRNSEIYYSFTEMNDVFAVHPTSGVISLTRPLSYIEKTTYDLEVLAKDRGPQNGRSFDGSKASVRIEVVEINAHSPQIRIQKLPHLVKHSFVGTVYAIVYVRDRDYGSNGEIASVNILDSENGNYFRLDQGDESGQYNVKVAKSLDRRNIPEGLNLTIEATDGGNPARSTKEVLFVELEGTNDKLPNFEFPDYNVSIEECVPVDTPLVFVQVKKNSNTPSDVITYTITNGKERDWFQIHSKSGLISVKQNMDTEAEKSLDLIVTALDHSNHNFPKSSQVHVLVNIQDCNDNDPLFNVSNPVVAVEENLPVETEIYKVSAYDPDLGDNGYISYSIANSEEVPFSIDHGTGKVTTTKVLDYESMRRTYDILVRASDWGSPYRRESQMTLKIKLTNINDNRPEFEKINCLGHLSREAPVGTQLVTMSAIDLDAGNIISYEIVKGNDDGCFEIFATTGSIQTKCTLAGMTQNIRSLAVTATDGLNVAVPTTINITLVNNNRNQALSNMDANFVCADTDVTQRLSQLLQRSARNNDNIGSSVSIVKSPYTTNSYRPRFSHTVPQEISVLENSPVGDVVGHFVASDDDHGYNGLLMYVIAGGNAGGMFRMDTYTGDLLVLSNLDRETQDEYTLNITVTDMAVKPKAMYHILTVHISDINDNAPTFEQETYSLLVLEDTRVNTSVLQVRATDKDLRKNAAISYSVLTDVKEFKIDPITGLISIASALDREKQELFELIVQAKDGSEDNVLYSTAQVLVSVDDVNDNPPMFHPSEYRINIREDIPIGAVVMTLTAHDPDKEGGGVIRYSLSGGDGIFKIDHQTGTVRVISELNFELQPVFNMTGEARDRGVPSRRSRCQIFIEVVDVDENLYPPVFKDFVFEGHVKENRESGTEVIRIIAEDWDKHSNSAATRKDYDIVYSIVSGTGLGRFTIDNKGVIRTNAILDRESQSFYWLTVIAEDRGTVPRSTVVEVLIEVEDVNDNTPQTTEPVYYPTVFENSPTGVSVVSLYAQDRDASSNNQVSYEITSGNPQGFFTIDAVTGLISTTSRTLDREQQEEHILEVTVKDNGTPSFSSTTRVVVTVLDKNDEMPIFAEATYRVRIPEMPSSSYIMPLFRVLASDNDVDQNAEITYSIKSGKGDGRFEIHRKTGMIFSKKEFVAGATYDLVLKAADNGYPQLKSLSRLLLTVVPRPTSSPHPPRFKSERISTKVVETDRVGELVRVMDATDEDEDKIWYSIVAGNDEDIFSINSVSGTILVAGKLNWLLCKQYNLTIQASDAVHYTRTWLHITVIDINDNRPEFNQSTYVKHIPENASPGTEVLVVTATDPDEDQRLFYTIHAYRDRESQGKFQINSETGVITTTSDLNREAMSKHELTIMVRDQGSQSKRTLTRVIVYVDDHNDHSPEFLTDVYHGWVFETAAMGTRVVTAMAIDRDKGKNAELQYTIISGNVGNSFAIDRRTGLVTVIKPLDLHVQSEFDLTVKATDGGSPSLDATVQVKIHVTVANSAPPKFRVTEYTTNLAENRPENEYITSITASSQSSITYDIVEGDLNNCFSINPTSGVITSNVRFDFEEQHFYNLTVRATSVMSVHAETSVYVHIIDINDNSPVFTQQIYVGNISEEASTGSVVLDTTSSPLVIKATDLDSDRNSLLVYSIVETPAQEVFEIDTSTGVIKTKANLDHELSSMYTFTVQVKDLGLPSKTADVPATVMIYVSDVNDSPPLFEQEVYEARLLLPTYKDVGIVQVKAFDKDSEIYSHLAYEISSGNRDHYFAIDSQSGWIHVTNTGEMLDKYELEVSATDGMYQSVCIVEIQVDLSQNSGLQFTQDVYMTEIQENTESVEIVTVVQVTGQELNEQIVFTMLNPSTVFEIGETSGVVQTTGRPFDREEKDNYTLVVSVCDKRSPPRTAQALVKVTVQDQNDNPPRFMRLPYYTMLSLDAAVGDLAKKVYTVDQDIGANGKVEYSIVKGAEGKFDINPRSGDITLRSVFSDQDENRVFRLTVQATDKGNPSLSSTVEVPITIKNRNTPVFESQYYETDVKEDVFMFSSILSVEATSPTGRKLIYSIASGNVYGEYDVDFSTGSIVVIDKLDYETTTSYQLSIRATDTMTGSFAEAIVKVNIVDVNDNAPVFDSLHYTITFSEASPVGTSVVNIIGHDPDMGISSNLQYKIEPSTDGQNDSNYFHIDSENGVILLKQKVDHEYKSTLQFTVTAVDNWLPVKSASVPVTVMISDLNDNRPEFDQPSYDTVITDLAKRGQFVTIVMATDRDSSDADSLRYSIVGGNERQTFNIDDKTGILSLSSLRKPDLLPSYVLNVSVTDGVFNSFARVQVTVRNSNSHVPVFSHVLYDVDTSENLIPGTRVTTVKARDLDQGIYGDVVYDIDSTDLKDVFRIDSETGDLFTDVPLDREHTSLYIVPIVARDGGGRAGFAKVRVNVADQGDQRPKFTQEEFKANVYATADEQTHVVNVTAIDADIGSNGEIDYSLYDGDGIPASNWFDINSKTGQIKTKRSLLDKENEIFQFFVRACDKGSPPKETDVPLWIYIMSPEEYPPVFNKIQYNYFISEDRPRGSIIATVEAQANDTITYSIVPGESKSSNKPARFDISEEGEISVIANLDREETEKFELSVMATIGEAPPLVAVCKVRVTIMDVNDNSPEFESDPYFVSIAENADIGSQLIQVIAHDTDTGANSDLSYSFAGEDIGLSSVFFLEAETGIITTLVSLDREAKDEYEFKVVVKDKGSQTQLSAVTTVEVTITDHNDEPPVFTQAVYRGAVNEDALPGTVVLSVVSTDLDLDANAEVAYSITDGNRFGQFAIKSTGEVYVLKELDREVISTYTLTITASDGAFISLASVVITVLDTNDNPPICKQTIYADFVAENIDVGSFILQVSASDNDEHGSRYATITYTLDNSFGVFNIEERSGIISNGQRLDRETVSEYTLTVRATDGGGLYCTMDVHLTLTDVNDNTPVFKKDMYSVMIPEDSTVNTLLTRVSATDRDLGINKKVEYAIQDDVKDYFNIDPHSGIISLKRQLDRERQPIYNVTIYAHDQGTPKMTSSSRLIVTLLDVNDNPPEFEHYMYTASVSEALSVRTPVMRVFATSRDTGINAEISYSVIGGNQLGKFSIDEKTGAVILEESLDYEKSKEYILTIEAQDKGIPPLSNTAVLKINITDHNDNSPVFSQSEYHVSVRENSKVGTRLLKVEATDMDSEPNAMVTYYIVRGDDDHQFAVHQQEGYIAVNEPLDRELISSYTLEVHAVDSGSPQLTGSAFIHVAILDVNDQPPVFDQTNYSAVIQEDKAIGHSVLQFKVTDADLDPNGGPFTFDIAEGNDGNEFFINSQDGVMYTRATFDRIFKEQYDLVVRVFDSGKSPLFSDSKVVVHIIEESAFPPTLRPLKVSVSANGDTFCGGIIGKMTASDRDPYDSLTFSIVEDGSEQFDIDPVNGTVEVVQCIDAGRYVVNASVTDGKYFVYGEVQLHVAEIDEELAQSAIVLRFEDVEPEAFISDYKQGLIEALEDVFSVDSSAVHVLSIQPTSESIGSRNKRDAQSGNLDVLVAVVNGDKPIQRNKVRKLVLRSRGDIGSSMGVRLMKVISDVCPEDDDAETCGMGECVTQVEFVSGEEITIVTEEESYVSPQHQLTYSCRCERHYTGPTCTEILDLCVPDPCPATHKCVSSGLDYNCDCPYPTSGPNCDCPFPTSGPNCEVDEPTCSGDDCYAVTFLGQSYMMYKVNSPMERQLHLQLDVRTVQSNGRLMQVEGTVDYSILEIENGLVQFRFQCGSGEGFAQINKVPINDGSWHTILVERNSRSLKITLDGIYTGEGSAPGGNDVLNSDGYMYFGGEILRGSGDIQSGFVGCMRNMAIENVPLPQTGSSSAAIMQKAVKIESNCRGIYIPGVCSSDPCLNGGTCVPGVQDSFRCNCHSRFMGPQCETDTNPCASNPCRNGGLCENRASSYQCLCGANFSGLQCDISNFCRDNPCLNDGVCKESSNGAICQCTGFHGNYCEYDLDECLQEPAPCQNGGVCLNVRGSFMCNCSLHTSGDLCETLVVPSVKNSQLPFGLGVEELVGIGCSILIILFAVILFVVFMKWRRNRKRHLGQRLKQDKGQKDLYYSENDLRVRNKLGSLENNINQSQTPPPSRSPPPVPARPASYTPSVAESMNTLSNYGMDSARNYGSAGDDLQDIPTIKGPIEIPDFLKNLDVDKPLRTNQKSPPPPPRKLESAGSSKQNWDPNIKENYPDEPKKQHKVMPLSSDHHRTRPSQKVPLLPSANGSIASIAMTEGDDEGMQGYHWDTSDWYPDSNPLPEIAELPSNSVHNTPQVSHRSSNPIDNITIDNSEYSYTDFQDEDDFDPEFVGEAEFTENEGGSDNEINDIDSEFDPPDYQDILKGDFQQYMPHYSDIENSQAGDSRWGSRDVMEMNGNFDGPHNIAPGTDDDVIHYGFSLPRPRNKHFRPQQQDNRFSGEFNLDYVEMRPLDDLSVSVAGYQSTNASVVSSINNLCDIEDSEANLSESDSENQSNESTKLVKSNTNLHTMV